MAEKDNSKKVINLTATELKKQGKKLKSRKDATIDLNGSDYKIKIDEVFRKTKQHQVTEDLIKFFNAGNDRADLLDLATPYTTLLIIKHFTSVEIPDDIDEAIEMLHVLIDLDALSKILEAMPEDQVLDMYETLNAMMSRIKDNYSETEDEISELMSKVENDEVKEMLKDGKE